MADEQEDFERRVRHSARGLQWALVAASCRFATVVLLCCYSRYSYDTAPWFLILNLGAVAFGLVAVGHAAIAASLGEKGWSLATSWVLAVGSSVTSFMPPFAIIVFF